MVAAALRAPDHGGLRPWRLIEFRLEARQALADLFEDEKRDRDSSASPEDVGRAREHATNPPLLLAFVVSPKQGVVPAIEQWLSAGAALGNLLNAAHMQGFGAIVLSGDRVYSRRVCSALGIGPAEHLAGFVSLGRIGKAPSAALAPEPEDVISAWPGSLALQAPDGASSPT